MSYQLSRLDLVVNNATTQITVNTNPSTQGYINGDITPQDNVITIATTVNRFTNPDDYPAATVKSTSKAASLTDLTATELGTINIPISATVEGNGLKNLITSYYEGITYTPQLLTCVGVNSTSTTIQDLSTNNFTITNNGAATASSFAPFPSSYAYSSVLFDGTTQSLTNTVAAGSSLDLADGAGNWTVECWFNMSTITGSRTLFCKGGSSGTVNPSYVLTIVDGVGQSVVGNGGSGGGVLPLATTVLANTWYHFALVRSGNVLNSYLNGVAGTPAVMNFVMSNTANNLFGIGRATDTGTNFFPGYISNFRVVKGAALYRGNFLPPTINFSAASVTTITTKVSATTTAYTKLTYLPLNINLYNSLKYTAPTGQTEVYHSALTVNSYRAAATANINVISSQATMNVADRPDFYITGSDAPIVLSTEGQPDVNTITTGVGALVFNGNLDKVTYTGDPENINISADFTLEFWLKPTSWGQDVVSMVMGNRAQQSLGWCIFKNSSADDCRRLSFRSTSGNLVSSDVTSNVWQHWALVRSGSALSWWKNGRIDTSTTSPPGSLLGGEPFSLGYGITGGSLSERNSAAFEISNLRIVKGTALYTSTFIPLAPLNVVANTTLLLQVTDSPNRLLDEVSGTTLTNSGVTFNSVGPNITNTVSNGSLEFNGSGYLYYPSSTAFALDTGDFTIEYWIRFNNVTGTKRIFGNVTDLAFDTGFSMDTNSTQLGYGGWNTFTYFTPSGGLSATFLNKWVHVAWVRISGVEKLYLNGALADTQTRSLNFSNTTGVYLGVAGPATLGSPMTGNISNFRIVKGVGVYSSNFNIPTRPLKFAQSINGSAFPSASISGTQTSILLNTYYDNNNFQADSSTNKFIPVGNTGVVLSNVSPPIIGSSNTGNASPGAYVSTAGAPAFIRNKTKYNDPTQVEGYFSSFIPAHTGEQDRVQAWV